jgi:hypothetical protein
MDEPKIAGRFLNPGSGIDYPGFAFTALKSESRLEDEPGFFYKARLKL